MGGAAAEPRATYARGDTPNAPISFPFANPQKLRSGIREFDIRWMGPSVQVVVKQPNGNVVFRHGPLSKTILHIVLPRALEAEDKMTVELVAEQSKTSIDIAGAPADSMPVPPGIGTITSLGAEERAIYALWLSLAGPKEWRVMGYSLLTTEARENLMVWKTWRAVNAGSQEK
jgi:hypothetical protein